MNEVYAVLIDKYKSSKFFIIIIISSLIISLQKFLPQQYEKFKECIILTYNIIYDDFLIFIIGIFIIYTIVILMKYSEKKSDEDFIERHYGKYEYESRSKYPFQMHIIEEKNYKYKSNRKIIFYNNSSRQLVSAKGQVNFYSNKAKVFYVTFEVEWVKNGYGVVVHDKNIDEIDDWLEFDFFIFDAEYSDKRIHNVRMEGNSYRQLLPSLKRYTQKSWIEKYIPYDLYWFKYDLYYHIRNRVLWHFRLRNVYERVPTRKTYIDRCKNLTRIIISIPIIIVIVMIFITGIKAFLYDMYCIAYIWINYLKYFVRSVF